MFNDLAIFYKMFSCVHVQEPYHRKRSSIYCDKIAKSLTVSIENHKVGKKFSIANNLTVNSVHYSYHIF